MITNIKLKELLKLYDPTKDNVQVNNETFIIDMKKLSRLVNDPNETLFKHNEDHIENFYNNLALYIINFESLKHISIDLENKNPSDIIKNGLTHYIAAIYLKCTNIYVDIQENNLGSNFIKNKKLEKTEDKTIEHIDQINIGKLDMGDEGLVEGFFTWVNGDTNLEKDLSFYIKSLDECIEKNTSKRNRRAEDYNKELSNVLKVYKQIPISIRNSDIFIQEVFKNKTLASSMFELYSREQDVLDFGSEQIKNIILGQVENGDLFWIEKIYSEGQSYNNQKILNKIRYTDELYNHPKTIEHFLSKSSSNNYYRSSSEFCLKNIYKKLSSENQTREDISLQYLESCASDGSRDNKWIYSSDLFQVPLKTLTKPTILKTVAYTIEWDSLKSNIRKEGLEPLNLDKEFILDVAKTMSASKFESMINNFYKKETFDYDFKIKILEKNHKLFESSFFKELYKNIEFIQYLNKNIHIEHKNIDFSYIRPFLFDKTLTDGQQKFLEEYMVVTKKNLSRPKDLGIPQEHHEEFKEKYQKLDTLFYTIDNWSSWRDDGIKRVKKIKDPSEMCELFKNINNNSYSYPVDSTSLFSGISNELKNDSRVIFSFLENIESPNIDLRQCSKVLYNTKNCIKLLDFDVTYRKYIPEQIYFDKDFSLALAQKLDKNPNFENIPVKVKKFFEQKEVTDNYYGFLKSFISYNETRNELNKELNRKTEEKPSMVVKKIKI